MMTDNVHAAACMATGCTAAPSADAHKGFSRCSRNLRGHAKAAQHDCQAPRRPAWVNNRLVKPQSVSGTTSWHPHHLDAAPRVPRAEPAGLAGDSHPLSGLGAAELLPEDPGGRPEGHHQAAVRGQHPQGRAVSEKTLCFVQQIQIAILEEAIAPLRRTLPCQELLLCTPPAPVQAAGKAAGRNSCGVFRNRGGAMHSCQQRLERCWMRRMSGGRKHSCSRTCIYNDSNSYETTRANHTEREGGGDAQLLNDLGWHAGTTTWHAISTRESTRAPTAGATWGRCWRRRMSGGRMGSCSRTWTWSRCSTATWRTCPVSHE